MVDYPNIFGQGMSAFDDQTRRLNAFDQQRASKTAGAAIANGDYTGGANVFNRAGMVDQAHNVLADQQVLQDRKTAEQNTAEDRATKAKTLAADNFGKALSAIQDVPEGQRLPWIQQHAADLQILGIPVDRFQGKTEADVSNASIAPLWKVLGKTKEDFTLTPGQHRFTGQGKEIASLPETQKYMPITAGGALVPIPNGNAPPTTVTAPAPAAAGPVDASAPRGLRNNNPLNLTPLAQGQWAGQTGTDGRYATFATPEAGMAAADQNLQAYATHHGINTLNGIVARWAPAGDGANDPKAYAATVAADIGVDPNQPLNLADAKVRAVVLHSMSKVELGTRAGAPQGAPLAASAPAADGLPPGTIRGPAKAPVWKSDGKGNLVNENGDRKIDPTVAGAGGTPTGDTNLAGPDYLKGLPAARGAQVQAMLDGRLGYPGAMALKTPYWQSMIADAAQADPEFDATKFAARAKMRTSAATPTASGLGGQLASINTAIGHLGTLQSAIAPLDNSRFDLINPAIIGYKQHFGSPAQQKAVKDYETAALTVSTEIPKALRGAGVAESDIRAWQKIFKVNDAPASQQAAVAKAVDLLDSRLEPLQTLWSTTMGSSSGPLTVIYPKAAQTLERLKAGSGSPAANAPASGNVIRYNAQGQRIAG